jgi:hypothetical protein
VFSVLLPVDVLLDENVNPVPETAQVNGPTPSSIVITSESVGPIVIGFPLFHVGDEYDGAQHWISSPQMLLPADDSTYT